MRRTGRQIAALAVLLLGICLVWRVFHDNTTMLRIPIDPQQGQEIEPGAGNVPGVQEPEAGAGKERSLQFIPGDNENGPEQTGQEGIARFGEPVFHEDYVEVPMKAQRRGEAWYEVQLDGERVSYVSAAVGPFMTVYDRGTGSFTGEGIVLCAVTAFFFLTALILLRSFAKEKGPGMYSYYTIYCSGFGFFALVCAGVMLYVTIRHFVNPFRFSMMEAYQFISGAGYLFILWTSPCILLFSLLLVISNAELLRHEAFRLQNVLGIVAAVVIVGGAALGVYGKMQNFSGSIQAMRVHEAVRNLYCTVYAYCECMLLGSAAGALRAAIHRPGLDQDYIIILGCGMRRDGSLTPLLKARCDAALTFWRTQLEKSGKEAVLVPSGGQGPDEIMPEAEAMGRYLRSCNVPGRAVRQEDRSRNTYQNMEFSRKIIEEADPHARVVFATSAYHVFRSGVWAGLAGLRAEGIGARTKWWFWPNAFMRECLGLLRSRIIQEIVGLAIMAGFFGLLTVLLI